MTGQALIRLMRRHRVTIRTLAARLGISLVRVRQVRAAGLRDPHYVRDWTQAITGKDPGPQYERSE